jgi:hypothetical protein
MAQFALTSSHQRRIPANVAVGMAQVANLKSALKFPGNYLKSAC